jgi:hypothetical protein
MFQRTLLTASRRLAVAPRATLASRRTFVSSVVRPTAVEKGAKNFKTFSGSSTTSNCSYRSMNG